MEPLNAVTDQTNQLCAVSRDEELNTIKRIKEACGSDPVINPGPCRHASKTTVCAISSVQRFGEQLVT